MLRKKICNFCVNAIYYIDSWNLQTKSETSEIHISFCGYSETRIVYLLSFDFCFETWDSNFSNFFLLELEMNNQRLGGLNRVGLNYDSGRTETSTSTSSGTTSSPVGRANSTLSGTCTMTMTPSRFWLLSSNIQHPASTAERTQRLCLWQVLLRLRRGVRLQLDPPLLGHRLLQGQRVRHPPAARRRAGHDRQEEEPQRHRHRQDQEDVQVQTLRGLVRDSHNLLGRMFSYFHLCN